MSPVTHFLFGWTVFERAFASRRDKALVVAAGVAPDFDAAGVLADLANRALGLPDSHYFESFHRMLGHGLAAAIVLAVGAALLAERKGRMAVLAFLCVHLHFLCDVVGSRGGDAADLWNIYYLAPFSRAWEFSWRGQWPLAGWQNLLITAVLLALVFVQAVRRGYSPLVLFSARADAAFVRTLRGWRQRMAGVR